MVEHALSYEEYLASLPLERRHEVAKVWQIVRENMPDGYVEEIDPKFLSFKAGADWYVALANQKNYISLHLMRVYVFTELKAKLDESGKKLKGGKSCINFEKADELPLGVVAEIISAHDAEAYKERLRQIRGQSRGRRGRAGGERDAPDGTI